MFRPKSRPSSDEITRIYELKMIKLRKTCDLFCIFVISPEDGTNSRPKHVAFMGYE